MAGNRSSGRVLIDTPVWIAFFRGIEPHAEVLAGILREGNAVTTGIIKAELIQGVRNVKEGQKLLRVFAAVEEITISDNHWVRAGWLAFELRQKGYVVPLTDAAIGTLAIMDDLSLYTIDKHFSSFPNLKIFKATG